jgi:hypothetical protein
MMPQLWLRNGWKFRRAAVSTVFRVRRYASADELPSGAYFRSNRNALSGSSEYGRSARVAAAIF